MRLMLPAYVKPHVAFNNAIGRSRGERDQSEQN
jgi:hypothetical protein